MARGDEHLRNVFPFVFFLKHVLMIAFAMIHFVSCANQSPVSVSRDLIFSVLLGLDKTQRTLSEADVFL